MDTQDFTVLSKIIPYAQRDTEYQQRLSRCRETEIFYCSIMESLSDEQRTYLDAYYYACAELIFRLINLAFRYGQISARKMK